MSTIIPSKNLATNVQTESLGNGLFRKELFNAPAETFLARPVTVVAPADDWTFQATPLNRTISVDATLNAGEVILPPARGNGGLEITVKNRKGINTVTVIPTVGDLIDDHQSVALAGRGDAATFEAIDDDIETGWIVTSAVSDIS